MDYWKLTPDKTPAARLAFFSDWPILLEAWIVQVYFILVLYFISFEDLLARANRQSKSTTFSGPVFEKAVRIQRLADLSARFHFPRATCLSRSLALEWILNRRSIPARLCLGVLKNPAGLQAHAWLEVSGLPLGEPEAVPEHFSRLL